MNHLLDILMATWATLAEMAPYLLLGFAVAGLLSVAVSKSWVERHLGGRGIVSSFKAALFGVPLPLCSCGVIPVAASLRQHGAGKGAVTSFLLSTPQTGVDSIFATYGLLGLPIAILRPLVAFVSGVVGGVIVDRLEPSAVAVDPPAAPAAPASDPCADACDTGKASVSKWRDALHYGAITLPNDIAWPLIVGILIAGVITAVAQPGALEPYIGGWTGMAVMLVIGIPLYVCSTGSIPLALGFIHLGATPGAAVVFLVSGPATNAATLAVNWKVLGKQATIVYLGTVVAASLGAGLLLDQVLAPWLGSVLPHMPEHHHEHAAAWWKQASAAALIVLLAAAMIRSRVSRPAATPKDASTNSQPAQILQVQGMTCSHCVAAVTRAIREQPGVEGAEVELAGGRAKVSGSRFDLEGVIGAIERLGYRVQRP